MLYIDGIAFIVSICMAAGFDGAMGWIMLIISMFFGYAACCDAWEVDDD